MDTTQIITNGTEKQIEWAAQIATAWITKVQNEIDSIARRMTSMGESPRLVAYHTNLQKRLAHMKGNLGKVPATDIIGMHKAGRDMANAIIDLARKA